MWGSLKYDVYKSNPQPQDKFKDITSTPYLQFLE